MADDISIVMVVFQGPHCVDGVLMLACMFGDQSLSDKYVNWYDGIIDKLDAIGDSVDKKTCLAVVMFYSSNTSNLRAYNKYLSPALWFS